MQKSECLATCIWSRVERRKGRTKLRGPRVNSFSPEPLSPPCSIRPSSICPRAERDEKRAGQKATQPRKWKFPEALNQFAPVNWPHYIRDKLICAGPLKSSFPAEFSPSLMLSGNFLNFAPFHRDKFAFLQLKFILANTCFFAVSTCWPRNQTMVLHFCNEVS